MDSQACYNDPLPQCNIDRPPKYVTPAEVASNPNPQQNKPRVAAPTGPVDISFPPLGTPPLTSTVEIAQNIIDQLLVKIVQGSYITADTNEVLKQKPSKSTAITYIAKDLINTDWKTSNANEEYLENRNKKENLQVS